MSATKTADGLKCMAMVRYRHVLGIKRPQSYYLAFGNAWDRTSDAFFIEKKQRGVSMPASQVKEVMEFALKDEFANAEPVSAADESRVEMVDQGVKLAATWQNDLAQYIEPIAVQEAFRVELGPSVPFRIAGILDLAAEAPALAARTSIFQPGPFFSDAKTSKRKWTTKQVQDSLQAPIYMLARKTLGLATNRFQFHVGVRKKEPEMQILERKIEATDIQHAVTVMELVNKQIRAAWQTGAWVPNRQHVMCSRKYCPYWRECERDYGGTVSGAQEEV